MLPHLCSAPVHGKRVFHAETDPYQISARSVNIWENGGQKPVFDQRTAVPCMWHGRQHEFLQIAVCLNCFRTGFITVHTLHVHAYAVGMHVRYMILMKLFLLCCIVLWAEYNQAAAS